MANEADRLKEIRERAEKWLRSQPNYAGSRDDIETDSAMYHEVERLSAFAQSEREAAERETLERCAKIADTNAYNSRGAKYVAAKIRALSDELARGKGDAV